MDNTTNLSQTSVPQIPSLYSNSNSNFTSSSSTSGISDFFTGIQNINMTTWLIIIFILAFLGFNIFVYLAKGTQDITSFFTPLLNQIIKIITSVTGQTLNVSAEGAKTVVSGTADTINTGLTSVQNIATPNPTTSTIPNSVTPNSNLKGQPINQQPINQQQIDIMQQTSLNRALNASQQQQQQQQDYQANEATSSVHGGKSGWCYVGEERGYRTCAQVGVNDTCMSGDIFPSQEICVNPSLRP